MKHQFTSIRGQKILVIYWWIYGIYLALISAVYFYQGVVTENGGYITTSFYILFALFWYALLLTNDAFNKKYRAMYSELLDMDRDMMNDMNKFMGEQMTEIRRLEAENATLKASIPEPTN